MPAAMLGSVWTGPGESDSDSSRIQLAAIFKGSSKEVRHFNLLSDGNLPYVYRFHWKFSVTIQQILIGNMGQNTGRKIIKPPYHSCAFINKALYSFFRITGIYNLEKRVVNDILRKIKKCIAVIFSQVHNELFLIQIQSKNSFYFLHRVVK